MSHHHHHHVSESDSPPIDLSRQLTSADQVAELIQYLGSPARSVPVVILSPAKGTPRFPVPPDELATELSGVADVYAIAAPALCWELDGTPEWRTYGGAVRIVGNDVANTVIRTDGDPETAFDRIAMAARIAARRMPRLHVVDAESGSDSPADETAQFEENLRAETEARRKAEKRASTAERALSEARAEIAKLRAAIAAEAAPLFSDPEDQFRDDVQRSWLRQVAESERERWPLREFRVGPDFLANLDIPQAPRAKIVEVVVDILTRRAFEMPSRSVRAHGDGGPAGIHGQVVRADGAAGYRCNIRSNTAQAPRLVWWELVDGTVELSRASRHDDPVSG